MSPLAPYQNWLMEMTLNHWFVGSNPTGATSHQSQEETYDIRHIVAIVNIHHKKGERIFMLCVYCKKDQGRFAFSSIDQKITYLLCERCTNKKPKLFPPYIPSVSEQFDEIMASLMNTTQEDDTQ